MKHLNQHATKIAIKLFELMIDHGGQFVLDKNAADSGIMPVHLTKKEAIITITPGNAAWNNVFSIAHFYEQDGQQMSDPYMEFMVSESLDIVTPILFKQSNPPREQQALVWDNGTVKGYNAAIQYDMAYFSNKWMQNIKRQQNLK